MPIALPAQPCENGVISWRTEFDQLADTFSRSVPLFQMAHANTTSEPMVRFDGIVILHRDAEVVHPSTKIETDLPESKLHRDAPASACKSAKLGLKAVHGFLGDGESFTGEGKS